MDKNTICPEIHYEETTAGIRITAYDGMEDQVYLPDEIDGQMVTSIAPYAFAENHLSEIRLPQGVTDVGKYAFYRCKNLKKMTLSDGILEIGGGALTGCRIEEVEIHHHRGKQSALKSILDEIRFAIHARLYYDDKNGTIQIADLLFPEHYEEAVENTPARILYTSHHGAGGYYRQCFYDRQLDYKKYDETFLRTVTEDSVITAVCLAMGRLRFPYDLSQKAKEIYESYVKEHLSEAVCYYVEEEKQDALAFFSERQFWTKEAMDAGIDRAGVLGKTEILSVLMDKRQKFFPKKKKSFEL